MSCIVTRCQRPYGLLIVEGEGMLTDLELRTPVKCTRKPEVQYSVQLDVALSTSFAGPGGRALSA